MICKGILRLCLWYDSRECIFVWYCCMNCLYLLRHDVYASVYDTVFLVNMSVYSILLVFNLHIHAYTHSS